MDPDETIVDVSFLPTDKTDVHMMDFVDKASYALGSKAEDALTDDPHALDADAVLFFMCKKYKIPDDILSTERYRVLRIGKKIRIYPLVWENESA